MKGESLAAAALTFAATYGVDLLRIPVIRDLPLKEQTSLDRPHDLTQFSELSGLERFWLERAEALKAVYKMAEQKLAIFETVPGPYTGLSYVCGKDLLKETEQNHPTFLDKALQTVTASLKNYLRRILEAGDLDGLVIEIESATFEQREPEVFEHTVKPHLREMINFVTQTSEIPIWLHVRGTRVYLKPLLDLPHQMISWPHLSSGPKLQKAFPKGYKGVIAGGLNEVAICEMSYQDIRLHVEEARDHFVSMLTVGDQLPTDLSPSRLKALATFLSKRDRIPEKKAKDPVIE
jgi:uroporphyrinogen-III decarboxylase